MDQSQLQEVATPDILQENSTYKEHLKQLPEVQALTSEIQIDDINSILKFGAKPGEELAKMSDQILATLTVPTNKEAMQMFSKLSKIMSKFDMAELKDVTPDSNPGLFKRIKNALTENIEAIIAKYDNLGKEVDNVYLLIKEFEQQTLESNRKLTDMYNQNLLAYQEYEKYVAAGDIAKEELLQARRAIEAQTTISDYEKDSQLQKADLLIQTLDQRIMDMVTGETVAQVTVPMLMNMQRANVDLLRKYNSAFTVGIPIFKNNLAQAVLLKRQAIQAKSMEDFDEAVRQQFQANAERTAQVSGQIARMTNRSAFSYDDLQKAYDTVQQGQVEVEQAIEQANAKRQEDRKKIEQLQLEMKRG